MAVSLHLGGLGAGLVKWGGQAGSVLSLGTPRWGELPACSSTSRCQSSPCQACMKGTGREAREQLLPFLTSSLQGNRGVFLRGLCPQATVPSTGLARSVHGARRLGFLSSKPPEPGCN